MIECVARGGFTRRVYGPFDAVYTEEGGIADTIIDQIGACPAAKTLTVATLASDDKTTASCVSRVLSRLIADDSSHPVDVSIFLVQTKNGGGGVAGSVTDVLASYLGPDEVTRGERRHSRGLFASTEHEHEKRVGTVLQARLRERARKRDEPYVRVRAATNDDVKRLRRILRHLATQRTKEGPRSPSDSPRPFSTERPHLRQSTTRDAFTVSSTTSRGRTKEETPTHDSCLVVALYLSHADAPALTPSGAQGSQSVVFVDFPKAASPAIHALALACQETNDPGERETHNGSMFFPQPPPPAPLKARRSRLTLFLHHTFDAFSPSSRFVFALPLSPSSTDAATSQRRLAALAAIGQRQRVVPNRGGATFRRSTMLAECRHPCTMNWVRTPDS